MATLRDILNNVDIKVEIQAQAKSSYSKELIEAQLARQDLPLDQRQYLENLKKRKFNN